MIESLDLRKKKWFEKFRKKWAYFSGITQFSYLWRAYRKIKAQKPWWNNSQMNIKKWPLVRFQYPLADLLQPSLLEYQEIDQNKAKNNSGINFYRIIPISSFCQLRIC